MGIFDPIPDDHPMYAPRARNEVKVSGIEKGVPIPRLRKRHLFDKMEVGDSKFIENADQNTITANVRYWAKKLGWVFTTQKQRGGIRVWRVS